MELIDTHGHLNLPPLLADWKTALYRSQAQGVRAIVMPGTTLETSRQSVELARQQPRVLFAGVGLHPTDVGPERIANSQWESFRELADEPEVVAIGEVGLDSYRSPDTLPAQEQALSAFLAIADEVAKPLILHCRGSKKPGQVIDHDPHERLITILAGRKARPKFVVHCFQGTAAQAEQYLRLGGFISFTGSITYTNDTVVMDAVRAVPLERLIVETDSPFLSPVPYRGETNEPWKVIEVVRRVAEITGMSVEEVAAQTTHNAISFFGLPVTA